VLLLCLTSTLQPVWLGRTEQEFKTAASIAIRVTEERNPPTTERLQHTGEVLTEAQNQQSMITYRGPASVIILHIMTDFGPLSTLTYM